MRMLSLLALLVVACKGSTGPSGDTDSGTDTSSGTEPNTGTDTNTGPAGIDIPSFLVHLDSSSEESCTLDDGSTTTCYELVFSGTNPTGDGPYCPPTIDDIGGLGIYDGETNPGLQVMKRDLWEAMEADGWDIVDDMGNINLVDEIGGSPPPFSSACMALPKVALTLTYIIPSNPVWVGTPDMLETVELVGVQLDGIPMTSDPPSVVNGPPMPGAMGGFIPSIEPCGGHPDPAGYYHAHFVAQSVDLVLDAYGISEVSCTRIAPAHEALVGFAKDGYPIYAPYEGGVVPSGLDACNGHNATTSDFPDGVYHYHALEEDAPNMPPCLMGASIRNAMSYQ